MIIATHTPKLDYNKSQKVNSLLKTFANSKISQAELEARLKKIGCSKVLKFYKE